MAVHRLKHIKAADGSSITESAEEERAWINARRDQFPSRQNLKRKAEVEDRRRQFGALMEEEKPKVGMLEKMLRKTHDIEAGSKGSWGDRKGGFKGGKGYYYPSWGKGSKGGKGKEKKGKGSKGGKLKCGGGKGFFKGGKHAKGDRWNSSPPLLALTMGEGQPEDTGPPLAMLCTQLPSMLANCVPVEAPFASQHTSYLAGLASSSGRPRQLCKYFAQGFCFHGDRCRYSHDPVLANGSQAGAAGGGAAGVPPGGFGQVWWRMPSMLANRAGRPGEGPMGPPTAESGKRLARFPRFQPLHSERDRRDGLLRRMLRPEMDQYYSSVLQCVRYIVATDFFRLLRVPGAPPLPGMEEDEDAELAVHDPFQYEEDPDEVLPSDADDDDEILAMALAEALA